LAFYEKLKHRRERCESIVEAPQGYVEVLFEGPFDWNLFTSDLGTTFQLVSPGFNIKRYPAHITTQWPIEAALTLQQKHNVRLEDVTSLEIEIPAGRTDRSQPDPRSGLASAETRDLLGHASSPLSRRAGSWTQLFT
jgi:2-methylcitrate dehydratase PrpD